MEIKILVTENLFIYIYTVTLILFFIYLFFKCLFK
jgi:hypothetical protein